MAIVAGNWPTGSETATSGNGSDTKGIARRGWLHLHGWMREVAYGIAACGRHKNLAAYLVDLVWCAPGVSSRLAPPQPGAGVGGPRAQDVLFP